MGLKPIQFKRLLVLLAFAVGISVIYAKTNIRIHHKGREHSDVAIEQIDSIAFIDGSDLPVNEGSLLSSWLWVIKRQNTMNY